MFSPGDVVLLFKGPANKPKFHLCISLNGYYLYVNSPKARSFPGDVVFPCSEFAFLDPTPSGLSIVSCNVVLPLSDRDLRAGRAVRKGTVSKAVLRAIVAEIESSTILPQEQIDQALYGLGDWL